MIVWHRKPIREAGMIEEGRRIVEAFWDAIARDDIAAMGALYAEDAVQEWPQSGERVVGRANIVAINENYPGMPKPTIRRISGTGHHWVCEATLTYGADIYESVNILEIVDGQIVRETDYFATPFEAPEWRALWTEKL